MFIQILKKSCFRACYIYTCLSILYLFITLGLFQTNANPYPLAVIRLFPFSFFLTFAHTLVMDIKEKGTWKLPTHFLIVTLDLIFFVWLPHKNTLSNRSTLILFIIYLVLYGLGALIIRLFGTKRTPKNSEYKSVYSQKKRK